MLKIAHPKKLDPRVMIHFAKATREENLEEVMQKKNTDANCRVKPFEIGG